MKIFEVGGKVELRPTGCLRKLLGYDTTAEAVMAALDKLEPGESYVITGRVKGSLVLGNVTATDCLFENTRVVRRGE